MCVTSHYIGNDWELNIKILAFCPIADHKGETIGKWLEKIIKEWGISKVCTVDNASSNNVALSYLVRRLNDVHETILKGEFIHLRCYAHILNLIVSVGLKEIDSSIERIRAAIRYVRSSPQRMSFFMQAAEYGQIDYKKKLCLDVPTRWNSMYLRLDCVEKIEKAFARLEDDNMSYLASFGHDYPPNSDDWKRARVFTKFLKIFYDATLSFSSSLHVTSNVFFHKLIDIQQTLLKWKDSDDFVLKSMAENMHKNFGKYWEDGENFNYLLFVAVVLDPSLFGNDVFHKLLVTGCTMESLVGLIKLEDSLLISAASEDDEPFLLLKVGKFNASKNTVINAFLWRRNFKEGVVISYWQGIGRITPPLDSNYTYFVLVSIEAGINMKIDVNFSDEDFAKSWLSSISCRRCNKFSD
ncbi:hypothetical protein L6164_013494 [Bauhinia variegata]|uniref:Uncharacterized protein n=1 Tax=Bauhinia variegata TaxID=167791 RepID=A0ACB9NEL1_BAUVA|nr:hypothetical protein L6164_013494 [Bauhinia variegata]